MAKISVFFSIRKGLNKIIEFQKSIYKKVSFSKYQIVRRHQSGSPKILNSKLVRQQKLNRSHS